KRHQRPARSFHSRGHRGDYTSQISPGQGQTAFFHSFIHQCSIRGIRPRSKKPDKEEKNMLNKKWLLVPINVLVPMMLFTVQVHGAETSSESKRIEELERAVTELKQEVARLKKENASAPEGKMKTKVTYDGK